MWVSRDEHVESTGEPDGTARKRAKRANDPSHRAVTLEALDVARYITT